MVRKNFPEEAVINLEPDECVGTEKSKSPMDRGAWWATVHKVAKSRMRLKQLSSHTHFSKRASHVALLVVKNPSANAGDIIDMRSIPALGRSPGRGHSNPLQ